MQHPVNRWHRKAGITAAGFLAYLLATGLPLQFSAELNLAQSYVSSSWVLDWYGFQAPLDVSGSGPIVQVDDQIYWQSRFIDTSQPLIGAVKLENFLVVATRHEVLILLEQTGETIDRLYMDTSIEQIGLGRQTGKQTGEQNGQPNDRVYLESSDGLLMGNSTLTNWTQSNGEAVDTIAWTLAAPLSATESAPYRRAYRARLLSIERWLQDLHSGRFFGRVGTIIVDAMSALLLILAATGLLIWWRSRPV